MAGIPLVGRRVFCRRSSETPGTTPEACSDFKSWTPLFAPKPAKLLAFRAVGRQLTGHQWWQVELFFKWIKQHLRIKRFYGTSENAVKTRIWIAVSVYVLVAIIKKQLGLEASLYTLMQVLSVTIFEKMPIGYP